MSISVPPPLDDEWYPPAPDAIALVEECDSMVAILVAERYQRVDVMRQEALAKARLRGREPSEVVERGIRLDLACALRITEHAAGMLIAQADALVHRYPTVLDSLGGARMTQSHALALIEALD